jgi:hypothetical protein
VDSEDIDLFSSVPRQVSGQRVRRGLMTSVTGVMRDDSQEAKIAQGLHVTAHVTDKLEPNQQALEIRTTLVI